MLLDKSGLRKKSKSSQQNEGDVIEASSQDDIDNALDAFIGAYQKGELT